MKIMRTGRLQPFINLPQTNTTNIPIIEVNSAEGFESNQKEELVFDVDEAVAEDVEEGGKVAELGELE